MEREMAGAFCFAMDVLRKGTRRGSYSRKRRLPVRGEKKTSPGKTSVHGLTAKSVGSRGSRGQMFSDREGESEENRSH